MSAPLLTIHEVAEYLNVHYKTIERWVADGRIPCYKVGPRAVRYDLEEVKAALLVPQGAGR